MEYYILCKYVNGKVKRMKFAVYALAWNEERLLPAFLHHYREATRIVIYDNESTDGTRALVTAAGREIRSFSTGSLFDDVEHRRLKNTIWKEARVDPVDPPVDYVVVQDLDEFLYFPDFPGDLCKGLEEMKRQGATCALCKGYQMVCSEGEWQSALKQRESFGADVASVICQGRESRWYDKVLVFNPRAIAETRYAMGAHHWSPVGEVVYAATRPYLLHFKFTGLEYTVQRYLSLGKRVCPEARSRHVARQYWCKEDEEGVRVMLESEYAHPTTLVTRPLTIKVVVGVHHSMEFLEEARRDRHTHVFAFDADETIIETNRRRFHPPPNYHLEAKAVSNREGITEFNVCANTTCSSLLDWGDGPRFGSMVKRPVQCITMRSFLERTGITSVDFLQVDTQGHDLAVLEGFEDLFGIVKKGVCESMAPETTWALYRGQASYSEVDSFLERQGFDRTWEYNVSGGCPRDEVNIYFTRRC